MRAAGEAITGGHFFVALCRVALRALAAPESCGRPLCQEVLNPEAMALLGDQPGDGGGGVGHLKGTAEGAGESSQLGRQQGPDPLLQGSDGGWIDGGLAGRAGGPDRGTVRRRLGPGDGSRGRGVPGAVSPLALIPGRSVEGSRDGVDLGRGAP